MGYLEYGSRGRSCAGQNMLTAGWLKGLIYLLYVPKHNMVYFSITSFTSRTCALCKNDASANSTSCRIGMAPSWNNAARIALASTRWESDPPVSILWSDHSYPIPRLVSFLRRH
jgi:hypothetical protein